MTYNTTALSAALLGSLVLGASAATSYQTSNALAGVSWDVFSFSSPTAGDSGSHGGSQSGFGSIIDSSELSTLILDSYTSPSGGLGSNPDTWYVHDGGYEWTATVALSQSATHVRVSYALLGFGGDPPEGFPNAPSIAGANVINNGSYANPSNVVFFFDLELDTPTSSVATTFGDVVFPGYPGSFRSVDGVGIEVFNTAPVPEPSGAMLGLLGAGLLLRRRR